MALPEQWKADIAKGYDPQALARAMVKLGLLVPDSNGRSARSERTGSKTTRVYVFAPDILDGGGNASCIEIGVTGVTGVTDGPSPSISAGLEPTNPVTPRPNDGVTGVTEQECARPAEMAPPPFDPEVVLDDEIASDAFTPARRGRRYRRQGS